VPLAVGAAEARAGGSFYLMADSFEIMNIASLIRLKSDEELREPMRMYLRLLEEHRSEIEAASWFRRFLIRRRLWRKVKRTLLHRI
jgi:hypothetical protein